MNYLVIYLIVGVSWALTNLIFGFRDEILMSKAMTRAASELPPEMAKAAEMRMNPEVWQRVMIFAAIADVLMWPIVAPMIYVAYLQAKKEGRHE